MFYSLAETFLGDQGLILKYNLYAKFINTTSKGLRKSLECLRNMLYAANFSLQPCKTSHEKVYLPYNIFYYFNFRVSKKQN